MEQFIASAQAFLKWLQLPGLIVGAVVLLAAGYCFMAMGQKGTAIGKTLLFGLGIGLVFVFGASVLVNSFSGNLKF